MADTDLPPDFLKGQLRINIRADKPPTQQLNKQFGIGPVDDHIRYLPSVGSGSNEILVHIVSNKHHSLRRNARALKRTLQFSHGIKKTAQRKHIIWTNPMRRPTFVEVVEQDPQALLLVEIGDQLGSKRYHIVLVEKLR